MANGPAWWRYRRALDAPAAVQHRLLLRYLRGNRDTVFGRIHGFARIGSIDEYRARVPLMRYEEYEPLIRRVATGEPAVLTAERVRRLAVTSGSTAAVKLIPYTATLHAEYERAVGAWVVDLYRARPHLAGGPAYWSLTPRVTSPSVPGAAVPVGFDEDSRYLGGLAHRFVDGAMAVPGWIRGIEDHETHRYLTILFLLRARALRLISVWHPSYLTLLMQAMQTNWESLVADIREGGAARAPGLPGACRRTPAARLRADKARADELGTLEPVRYDRIWPALGVVSCWGDAAARGPLDDLRRNWPNVFVQPKGLLATEAIVTFPFGTGVPPDPRTVEPARLSGGHHPRPLAICSHFFEFLDERGRVYLAHELEPGATYEVVVSTGGGLYRYRLGDRVCVDAIVGRTPSLTFLGREGNSSDLVGEKLHETFVADLITRLFQGHCPPRFAMLAPAGLSYTLFVEPGGALPQALAERLETGLRENPHYALAVRLGQLAPAGVVHIRDGFQTFADRAVARGQRVGDVKPVALHRDEGWSQVFASADPAPEERECIVH